MFGKDQTSVAHPAPQLGDERGKRLPCVGVGGKLERFAQKAEADMQ
jgi:hypothetical protein